METQRIGADHNDIVCIKQVPQRNFQWFDLKAFFKFLRVGICLYRNSESISTLKGPRKAL